MQSVKEFFINEVLNNLVMYDNVELFYSFLGTI